jgi:hypothetical protein
VDNDDEVVVRYNLGSEIVNWEGLKVKIKNSQMDSRLENNLADVRTGT